MVKWNPTHPATNLTRHPIQSLFYFLFYFIYSIQSLSLKPIHPLVLETLHYQTQYQLLYHKTIVGPDTQHNHHKSQIFSLHFFTFLPYPINITSFNNHTLPIQQHPLPLMGSIGIKRFVSESPLSSTFPFVFTFLIHSFRVTE